LGVSTRTASVGFRVSRGVASGLMDGETVGFLVELLDGERVGSLVRLLDGEIVGCLAGLTDGSRVGYDGQKEQNISK